MTTKPDVEQRVHQKIMKYGVEAVMHFAQDEIRYYTLYVEPVLLLQARVNIANGLCSRRVN
jgi:hypothetical protein